MTGDRSLLTAVVTTHSISTAWLVQDIMSVTVIPPLAFASGSVAFSVVVSASGYVWKYEVNKYHLRLY